MYYWLVNGFFFFADFFSHRLMALVFEWSLFIIDIRASCFALCSNFRFRMNKKKNYSEMNCWHTRWLECDTMYAFWCSGKRNKINDKFDYRLCHSRRMEQVRWSTALQTNMWSAYREPIKRAIQRLISTWGDRLGNMSDYEPFWPNFFWGLCWEESLLVHFAWQCVAE